MSRVFVWQDPQPASSYLQLLRRLNTYALVSTEGSKPWEMSVRVYRLRSDLKQATAYDAIAEALETTLMTGSMEKIDESDTERQKTLYLLHDSSMTGTVHAVMDDGVSVSFQQADLNTVEAILVPKKDPDYRLRQNLRIDGMCLTRDGQVIYAGLIHSGSEAIGIWFQTSVELPDAELILPAEITPCILDSTRDLIQALQSSSII